MSNETVWIDGAAQLPPEGEMVLVALSGMVRMGRLAMVNGDTPLIDVDGWEWMKPSQVFWMALPPPASGGPMSNDTRLKDAEIEQQLSAAFLREKGTETSFTTGEIEGDASSAARVAMRVLRSLNLLPR